MMVVKKNIVSFILFSFVWLSNSHATVHNVPSSFSTVALAVANATTVTGDTISIAAGTYAGSFTITKSLTVMGVGTSTLISGSISISANNVTCKDLKVQGSSIGISANAVSNLSLINVTAYLNSSYGASLNNISQLTVTGGTFSKNSNHGISIASCSGVTLTNVVADSNSKAGIQFYSVTGTNLLTNTTARKNDLHGLFIYYGTSGVTVQGGTFSNNGVNTNYDGGGIAIDAGTSKTVSNIAINGPLTIENNKTAGIWMTAPLSGDSIKNVVIGQSGLVSLSYHNSGGIIVYGNIYSTAITAYLTRGTQDGAGILLLGVSNSGTLSPQNTMINNCTFSGYIPGPVGTIRPAITLSSGTGQQCSATISGSGNTFVGYADAAAIEGIIYHQPDDPVLGLVTLTNNNPVPVELVSFNARVINQKASLEWRTATEVKNYGFEIERRSNKQGSWETIGFVFGNGTSNVPHQYRYTDQTVSSGTVDYRLKQIDADGSFSYSTIASIEIGSIPLSISNMANYPNPFNMSTHLTFTLSTEANVEILLYDGIGRMIGRIFNGFLTHGNHSIVYDAEHIVSGTYFYTLRANNYSKMGKFIFVK